MDVLLISNEDLPAEAEQISRVLSHLGVGLHTELSYKQGLESLVKHKYSIVILSCFDTADDLKYTEAVRLMKEIVPSLLVIAVSSDTPLEEERELRKSGLYFHLTAPVEEEELSAVLSGAIALERERRK